MEQGRFGAQFVSSELTNGSALRSASSFSRPDYSNKAVQDVLQRLATIDLLNLCNEAKIEHCRATRDLRSCGRPVECVLISCGHASLCAECSQRCDICPICRTPLAKNANRILPGLYYQCVEAGLIPRLSDGRPQEKDDEEAQMTADVKRLCSFFDVALGNNLCCLICQYVCMDDNAVSSDPVIAFLLDEIVVKDWCKRTFRSIVVELRQTYDLEGDRLKEGLDSLLGFAVKLSGLSNVLEVLELSFKDTQSAKLDDLQYLHESILKTKQHLEMMMWCIRHQFLDNVRSRHTDLQSWCNLFHERKKAAIARAWPEPANYSTDSTGQGTLFIEDALLNLEIEKGPQVHRDLEQDIASLQKDGGSSLIRSKIEGLVGCYPFENLRAVVDILFLYGNCDMVVAKHAIFLYYLFDRQWTVPEDEWRSILDDFVATLGIARHSLLESFCFYLLDDHSDEALQEACCLLPEIALPESHPKIAEVLLERQNPDAALMFLRWCGRDGGAELVSLDDAITATRVRVESGLLTEAFMYQRTMWMKAKERESKYPQMVIDSEHIKAKTCSWAKWVEFLVTEICLLCIRRNLVDRIIELPWNLDEEKHLHDCLLYHAIDDPSAIIGSLLVVYYLQRHRYVDAYHVEHKLRTAEQEFLMKNNIREEVLSRIKSTGHWRAGLVKNCVDLLPEVQQQQLRAGKLLGNSAWTSRDGGSNKDTEAYEGRDQAALPSSSDSSILLHIERMNSSLQTAGSTSSKPNNVHDNAFSSDVHPKPSSTAERGLKRHFDLINGKFSDGSFPATNGDNSTGPLAAKEIYQYSSRALLMAHQDGQIDDYSPDLDQTSFFKQLPKMSSHSSRRIMAKPGQTPLLNRGLLNNDSPLERHGSALSKMHSLGTQDRTETHDSSTDAMLWSQENGSAAEDTNRNGEARWRSGDTSDEEEEDHSPDLLSRTASRTPMRGLRRSRLSRR
ncbi:hypothetical protein V2J09_002644 [Rumex salicifolius]